MRGKVEEMAYPFFSPISVEAQDLGLAAARPGFRVEGIESFRDGDRQLVRLDFTAKESPRSNYLIRGGRLVLDPGRRWCVVSYDVQLLLHRPATASGRVEYGEDLDGFPIPRRYVTDVKFTEPSAGLFHKQIRCEIQVGRGRVSPEEFRLPYYGLPEPATPARSRGSIQYVLVSVGVLCLVGSSILALKARRARRPSDHSLGDG